MSNSIINKTLLFIILSVILGSCTSHDEPFSEGKDLDLQRPDSFLNSESKYIAVIGDIQGYTLSDSTVEFLNQTCDWLRSQQKYFDCFTCVLQNGDLTEGNYPIQWKYADSAFSHLGENIIVIPSTGNHDYTWSKNSEIKDRNTTRINSMKCLYALREKIIFQFEQNKLDNIIVPININTQSINIIALEFGPRKEAVTWVDSIVRNNPQKKFILMTHEWMTGKGKRVDKDSFASWQMPNISHSTPQEIWEKLVYPNDNILCVLCGHNGFCKYLYTPNQQGREVCQILFNLQYQKNGGDGMIQLWEFPKDENVINISVYNTITREFHPNPETSIRIHL